MAKTYINTVKYMIKLTFEIDGIVEKPDMIGAIFGQSEGLLGDEMDLKELQKNGKVGRIEIELNTAMGRTKGSVTVPSSMDMAETSLLAAGIESVDKVGPCEAKFTITEMDDTRTEKRDEIKNRAKEILKKMMAQASPETRSISEEIKENARAADIVTYGADALPAGPEIATSNEIIIVEGRADVLNLLRNQIKNAIGMNGSKITQTIIDLCKQKEVTIFIDGDRGGILNAKKLMQLAKVAYIAKAPDGKEVEELTRKEILQCLKRKEPAGEERPSSMPERRPEYRERYNDYRNSGDSRGPMDRRDTRGPRDIRGPRDNRFPDRRPMRNDFRDSRGPRDSRDRDSRPIRNDDFDRRAPKTSFLKPIEKPLTQEEEQLYRPMLQEMKGTMEGKILDEKNKELAKVKVKDLVEKIGKTKKGTTVIFDGVITKRLVEAAEKAGVKYVIGARKGRIEKNDKVKVEAL